MKKTLIAMPLPLEGSGSGQYMLDLAYWLEKRGHKITILTVSNPRTTAHKASFISLKLLGLP